MIVWALAISIGLAAPKTVVLSDGSELVGEVLYFGAKGCQIETEHLGLVTIPLSKVVEITPVAAKNRPRSVRSKVEKEMMALQLHRETQQRASEDQRQLIMTLLTANPAMEKTVKRLQAKPELIEAIADPQILLAIQTGDIQTLMANPAIRALLDKESLEALRRIEQKNGHLGPKRK